MGGKLVLVAVALACSGCLTGAQDLQPQSLPAAAGAPALPLRLGMQGCEDHVGITLIPIAADPIAMPEGFRQQPFDPVGLVGGHAVMGFACATSEGAVAEEAPAGFFGMVLVDPPDAYEVEGMDFYGVPVLASWSSSEALAQVFRAWGVMVLGAAGVEPRASAVGEVMVEVLAEGPGLRAGHVLATGEGKTAHMYTLAEGPVEQGPAGKGRLFAFAEGQAVGAIDIAWTEGNLLQNGQVVWRFEGFDVPPPPAIPGESVLQSWGDGYAYEWTYTALEGGAAANVHRPAPRLHGKPLAGTALPGPGI